MQTRKLRVGLIGGNWSLHGHLPAWRLFDDVEVAAICTAHRETAEAAAAEHGIPEAFWDFREMVRSPDLDLIDIGTRPSLREEMVLAAIDAGKHVLTANPFALDVAAARRMRQAQLTAGVVGMVECQIPWLPQVSRMKELLQEGYLGDLHSVTCHSYLPMVADQGALYPRVSRSTALPRPYDWLADRASGAGALHNIGGHALHALVHLFGEVEQITADLETFYDEWTFPDRSPIRPQTNDTAMLSFRFRNGGMGQLSTSWAGAGGARFLLDAMGSKGRLCLRAPSSFPQVHDTVLLGARHGDELAPGSDASVLDVPGRLFKAEGSSKGPADAFLPMARLFSDLRRAVGATGDGMPSFGAAVHVQQITDAAELAAVSRRWVHLDEV